MILEYKGINIFYTDEGTGNTVILLHGFLEDHTMWDFILPQIKKNNRVITIDLLGHGKTGSLGDTHLMSDMAEVVNAVLKKANIEESILIGHSMGGYVALAYAEKYTKKVKGLCLMNSTFESDDNELKAKRVKANKMVVTNYESMVRMSFGNLFSEISRDVFKNEFESALNVALNTSIEGYIGAQEGMRLRKDMTKFFLNGLFNKTIILGKKDAVLNSKRLLTITKKHGIPVAFFTEGHMSHIENKTECINKIMHFVENKRLFSDML